MSIYNHVFPLNSKRLLLFGPPSSSPHKPHCVNSDIIAPPRPWLLYVTHAETRASTFVIILNVVSRQIRHHLLAWQTKTFFYSALADLFATSIFYKPVHTMVCWIPHSKLLCQAHWSCHWWCHYLTGVDNWMNGADYREMHHLSIQWFIQSLL